MDNKYLEYTAEEMVDDRNFLIWLSHLSETQELDKLLDENPHFALKIREAKEIIRLLAVQEEPVLQEDVNAMWENIARFDRTYQSGFTIRRYHYRLKYAAAVLIILMLSTLGYWKIKQVESPQWYTFKPDTTVQQSRLILASGKEINLKKDESTISVNAKGHAIRINNDSLIAMSDLSEKSAVMPMNQVVVPYGKKSSVELEDGTKVWLNAGSKLAFPDKFTGSKREVFLEGEAYFNVTHDKNKPFFVKTKEVVIRVLGTKFNVSAYRADNEVMTVLVEGAVSLRENKGINLLGKETILNAHQRASFNKTDLTTRVSDEGNVGIYTAWTEGWFPFCKEPLVNVFKKVERYYNVQFVYSELFPSGDLISGKLDLKDSIEDVMKVLADVAKVTYRIDQKKIFIELKQEMPMRK
ncbi:MAG: FecR domain-containing protein [Prolixibacteraceae bacterium]|nr:FecR domain-containing protein [Prolixibacteraceae bacterium]